ncbi:siphovirus Gp157 family protein [Listeria monocytogenes]|nr:siphovirus Gp157 family protein [Listeria monocytogenes]
MKLYELTQAYNQVLEMAEDLDAETLQDTLDSIREPIEQKAENIIKMVKSMEAEVEGLAKEIERLAKRKNALEAKAKNMKEYVESEMLKVAIRKIKSPLFTISIQKTPPSLRLEDEEKLFMFLVEQPKKLDKKAIISALKEGREVSGAKLVQTESLRVR